MNDGLFPAREACLAALQQGRPQLLGMKLIADCETPVSAFLKLRQENKPCFLLESVQGGESRGRYSIIGIEPDLIWRCKGAKAEINRNAATNPDAFTPEPEPALTGLKALTAECRMDIPAGLPPMAAGLIGYMGYDMVRLMEELPEPKPDTLGLPDSCFMRPQVMLVFDTVKGELFVLSPIWKVEPTAEAAYDAAKQRIADVTQRLRAPMAASIGKEASEPLPFTSNTTREEYHRMVECAKEYIRAGDIFQVVPSQRFSTKFDLPAFALYRALRHLNPSPFLFYLSMQGFTLVGSSPEILVRLRDGKVTIRPIAGTRKRGATEAEDNALAADLLADPKEVAEHLMLLDLGRNDVGRIAEIGSVQVTQRMIIEKYSHVMHIVSNVEGKINKRYDAIDALVAGFPAGTVSGAPKIRAMEIINELEKEQRGFYAGCVGYFSANGTMDTCITLRTGLVKGGMLHVQAGGGVVADSDPEAEYQESVNKASAVMRAAQEAKRFV